MVSPEGMIIIFLNFFVLILGESSVGVVKNQKGGGRVCFQSAFAQSKLIFS